MGEYREHSLKSTTSVQIEIVLEKPRSGLLRKKPRSGLLRNEGRMAQMPIEVLDVRKTRDSVSLLSIISLVNKVQDQYLFSLLDDSKSYELLFSVHDDTDITAFESQLTARKVNWGFHPFLLCMFDTGIHSGREHNLFSVDRTSEGFAAVTVHNVDTMLIPSDKMEAYVVFQFALFALKFSVGDIPFHIEDRGGCIFEYRQNKRDIVEAIRKGYICDRCKQGPLQQGNGLSAVQLKSIDALLQVASRIIQGLHLAAPKRRPKIFIGSASEGLREAQFIQAELEHEFEVEIWNQSEVFGLGETTIEALEAAVRSYDFGIFVFTPHDRITMRDPRVAGLAYVGKRVRMHSGIRHYLRSDCGCQSTRTRPSLTTVSDRDSKFQSSN
jgi:CAP12/Pycsar effector protein, TIR domain